MSARRDLIVAFVFTALALIFVSIGVYYAVATEHLGSGVVCLVSGFVMAINAGRVFALSAWEED